MHCNIAFNRFPGSLTDGTDSGNVTFMKTSHSHMLREEALRRQGKLGRAQPAGQRAHAGRWVKVTDVVVLTVFALFLSLAFASWIPAMLVAGIGSLVMWSKGRRVPSQPLHITPEQQRDEALLLANATADHKRRLEEWINPAYSHLIGNVYHDDD